MKKIVVFLILLCSACSPPPEQKIEIKSPWYRPMDNPAHEFMEYPSFLYQPVQESLIAEAIAGLGEKPLLQLSTSEAERYAGNDLHMPMELRPFLIHALARPGSDSVVYYADRALWVDTVGGDGGKSQIREAPLVIFIDEVPPDVFVSVDQSSEFEFPEQP
ncbi:MAG: hypothetical protein ACU84Q_06360 [Gammaproteobacteria bacterium]